MNLTHDTSNDSSLTGAVIGDAIEVHRQLGPALDEVAYEEALSKRLTRRGIYSQRQVPLPLSYKGVRLDCGYRIDLLIERRLPLELKVVGQILGIHEAQLLTYLRIGRFSLGLLMNFNVAVLKQGIVRKTETRDWARLVEPTERDRTTDAHDSLSSRVIQSAVEVHRHVGPGLLPSAYLACLCQEFAMGGLSFGKEVRIPLLCDGEPLFAQAEVPLLIDKQLPVFPMSVNTITPVHTATALARLRQGGWKRGLLLNFNSITMSAGIRRVVA